MHSSSWYLFSNEMGYMFILLIKYLISKFLCSMGWHESLCIIKSVVVGFPHMLKVGVLRVFSMVYWMLGCIELNSFSVSYTFV
jgi:hypothetical protein